MRTVEKTNREKRRFPVFLMATLALIGPLGMGCTSIGRHFAVSSRANCPPKSEPNEAVRSAFYGVDADDIEKIAIQGELDFRGRPLVIGDPAIKRQMTEAFKTAYKTGTQFGDGEDCDSVKVVFKPKQSKRPEPFGISIPGYGPTPVLGMPFTNALRSASLQQADKTRNYVLSLGDTRRILSLRLTYGVDDASVKVTKPAEIDDLLDALTHLDENAFDYYHGGEDAYQIEIEQANRHKTTLFFWIATGSRKNNFASRVPEPLRGYVYELNRQIYGGKRLRSRPER